MRISRFLVGSSSVLLAYPLAGAVNLTAQATGNAPSSPVHLTSEQDHQRILDPLHITSLRRGPDGDPKSANAANIDESKVPSYSLPDPLVMKNGQRVNTAASKPR